MKRTFENMSIEEKEKYLAPLCLEFLQNNGGTATRNEIREALCQMDDDIAEYAKKIFISSNTSKPYSKFKFRANFAIKNLAMAGYLNAPRYGTEVTITDKGLAQDLKKLDVDKDIWDITKPKWAKLSQANKFKKDNSKLTEEELDEQLDDESLQEKYDENFKISLLDKISKMSPIKFEQFSRSLIRCMGIEFDEVGIKASNDGGIDGHGVYIDPKSLKTSVVVIQCKRYNTSTIGPALIREFKGSIADYSASYGIFITNNYFSKAAKKASLKGSTPVTLIDQDDLVELVKKHELGVRKITTYETIDNEF